MNEQLPLDRFAITARVMKTLARMRAHDDTLLARNDSGVAPIVVSLPDDRIGDVAGKVEAMGGKANVVLAGRDTFCILGWDLTDHESSESLTAHENSNMAMLRAFLDQHPDSSVKVTVNASSDNLQELAYSF